MKTRLLFLAALAATTVLFARCEGDTVGEPSPTPDDPACQGEKADDPSCQSSPLTSSNDAVSSSPDTTQPEPSDEPQKPAKDYKGVYCPNMGCVLMPSTASQAEDAWDRWDCVPNGTTAMKTEWVQDACGL